MKKFATGDDVTSKPSYQSKMTSKCELIAFLPDDSETRGKVLLEINPGKLKNMSNISKDTENKRNKLFIQLIEPYPRK